MSLVITPVRGKGELAAFLQVPYTIYADDPHYVFPMLSEQRAFLDPDHNPFFSHAEAQLWVAFQDGKPIGRIAACVDRLHIETHDEQTGFFGFYESPPDREVATALLNRAESWLRERKMQTMRGPCSFTTNHDYLGLFVEGEQSPPVVGMPYNPGYYKEQLEGFGLQKAKDLWAWQINAQNLEIPPKIQRNIDSLLKRGAFMVRPFNMSRFDEEARSVRNLYNLCWNKNWGFIPMTDEEFAYAAKDMKKMVDPDFLLLAEAEGDPIGFCLTIPDFNQALKPCKGRLFPFGFLKFLKAKGKIDYCRTLLLGVDPKYRHRGVDMVLVYQTFKAGFARGMLSGECSWVLEDNQAMNQILEGFGAKVYKTYRIYDLLLAS